LFARQEIFSDAGAWAQLTKRSGMLGYYYRPPTDRASEIGEFSKSLGRKNEPQLYVLEICPNVIYSLKNWTGKDGTHGACKDPVDVLRGMFLSQVGYTGENVYV
jgi:hypothetical protein